MEKHKEKSKAYREDQCEFRGEHNSVENPRQVRIQINWSLTMTLEGGNDGANASVTIQVRKETTVKQILEDAAGQLGMGHEVFEKLMLNVRS